MDNDFYIRLTVAEGTAESNIKHGSDFSLNGNKKSVNKKTYF